MKRNVMVVMSLVMLTFVAVYAVWASGAYAADSEAKGSESKGSETKTAAPAGSEAKGSDTKMAEPAGSETKGSATKAMRCTVVGKVEVRTEKVKEEEVSVPYVKVSEAKGPDDKAMPHMKGKLVKVVGANAANAKALAGKEVEVTGVVRMEIVADSVMTISSPQGSTYRGSSSK